jgi:transposase
VRPTKAGAVQRTKRNHIRQLKALGYKVTLEPVRAIHQKGQRDGDQGR